MWNEHRLVCACRFVYPLNGLHIAMRRLFHSILFKKGFPLSLQFPSFKNRIRLFHFIPLRYISFQSWSMKDFIPLRCIHLSVPLSSIKRISAIAPISLSDEYRTPPLSLRRSFMGISFRYASFIPDLRTHACEVYTLHISL